MKLWRVLPLICTLGACSTAPISYLSTTPKPATDAYSCALGKVNEMGYTVTNTNKEAGFITGDKQTSGAMTKIFSGSEYHDQLTVSIFEDAVSKARRIRVTTGQTDQKSNLLGGDSKSGKAPSDKGIADAQSLLAACGEGEIKKQATLTRITLESLAN